MKITALLLFIACLHVSARGFTQATVTISGKNMSIETILDQITEQTGYSYFIHNQEVEGFHPINISLKEAPLEKALEVCFRDQPYTYTITGKTIMVKRKLPAESLKNEKLPESSKVLIDVDGEVLNERREPLQRASVEVKGAKTGTYTDASGKFKLKQVDGDAILIVSFTGYAKQEIKLNSRSSISIILANSSSQLDELQVIAYGSVSKKLNTGDVSTVKGEDISKQPVSNPLAALEGRVAGMFVTQTTGVPGGGFNVEIRGKNSIANGNNPFYIIDGVPYASQTLGSINSNLHGGNPLNFINPADIESIEVLKDADATAIYGSRGANGVVLITTKRGQSGAVKTDLNVYSGIGKVTRMMNLLNTQQYLQMRHEAYKNDNIQNLPTNAYDINGTWDSTRYTDWQKVLIGNKAHYTDAQASVSGGNPNTQFLIGAGYHRETTVFPLGASDGSDAKASLHFNINTVSLNKKFKLTLSSNYISDINTVALTDQTSTAIYLPPDAPRLYNSDGTLNWAPITPGSVGTWSNPFNQSVINYKGQTYNLVSNGVLSYLVMPGLELRTALGYTNMQTNELFKVPTTAYDPGYHIASGTSQFNSTNIRTWIIEPQANYQLNIGRGVLTALIGATFQKGNNEGQSFNATGFSGDELLGNMQAATTLTVQSVINAEYKYNAFFGRLNYNLRNKYLFNITGRRDGSSRFGPAQQFANFGAIGGAWIFSNEDFIVRHFPLLSFGKLRASYGTSGNDQIGDYRFLDIYRNTQYPYQNTQGLYPINLFNPNLAWELNRKLEGGIELGFFKDRISLAASYYRNHSNNQLVNTPLSVVTGFSSIPSNLPALVQNTGFELLLNSVIIKTKTFVWASSLNLTIPSNKLLSFPNLSVSSYNSTYVIGQPVTIQKVFHLTNVDPATGVFEFADFKTNPTFSPNLITDRTVLINTSPKYYGGFQNSFKYKNFSLDVLFQFVNQIGPNLLSVYSSMPGSMANQPSTVLNRWQNQGDVKYFEKFSQNYSSAAWSAFINARSSDFVYGNASFIRLKNLALSWQLPQRLKLKMHLENFRIYLQGQNLFTITKYYGIDPETQGVSLPPLCVLTAGFQITL